MCVIFQNSFTDFEDRPLKLVKRGEWFALQRKGIVDEISVQPTPYVIVAETTSTSCLTTIGCSNVVRMIQNAHMISNNFSDIAYNFLIGGDGSAYECRGWNKSGAHTKHFNNRSIGISFIGIYRNSVPSLQMISAFWKLLDVGVKENKLPENYTIFAHRQVRLNSQVPGAPFYELIKKWPHWKEYDASKDRPPYTFFMEHDDPN